MTPDKTLIKTVTPDATDNGQISPNLKQGTFPDPAKTVPDPNKIADNITQTNTGDNGYSGGAQKSSFWDGVGNLLGGLFRGWNRQDVYDQGEPAGRMYDPNPFDHHNHYSQDNNLSHPGRRYDPPTTGGN